MKYINMRVACQTHTHTKEEEEIWKITICYEYLIKHNSIRCMYAKCLIFFQSFSLCADHAVWWWFLFLLLHTHTHTHLFYLFISVFGNLCLSFLVFIRSNYESLNRHLSNQLIMEFTLAICVYRPYWMYSICCCF